MRAPRKPQRASVTPRVVLGSKSMLTKKQQREIERQFQALPPEKKRQFIIKLMAETGHVLVGEEGDELFFDKATRQ